MAMWVLNMIVCCAIGFGCFIWAIWKTMDAEARKQRANKASSQTQASIT